MKDLLITLIQQALTDLSIPSNNIAINIDYPRERGHGDFACNIALLLAKPLRRKPQDIAHAIVAKLPKHVQIERVEVAGAGFINFFLAPTAWTSLLQDILQQQQQYGHSLRGQGQQIHLEFVSSNPTGPLHVGHGRGAAYGAALADLLTAVGYEVHREYYVNDAGRQMDILAVSLWLRYLAYCGETIVFPENAYQGDYLKAIAEHLYTQKARDFYHVLDTSNLPITENKENNMDALIAQIKTQLGESNFQIILDFALSAILQDIKQDLAEFGVNYQAWFSEKTLWQQDIAQSAIEQLRQAGHLYQKEGALWCRTTTFGDDKDRVIQRENGAYTYFASDIAYHWLKFTRGFKQVINILGADHHGYIPRLRAIIAALGFANEDFHTPLVQFAVLYRGAEKVSMSTRSGEFVTLRDLRQEVGNDAARFFYLMRKADQQVDFDLELAKSQSNENPLYYIQYAHARIASVFRQLSEKNLTWDKEIGLSQLAQLDSEPEKKLLLLIARYREVLMQAALQYAPHTLAYYLRELADGFHHYYHAVAFLTAEPSIRQARLTLIAAVRQLLANGLQLLGVSAPDIMQRT